MDADQIAYDYWRVSVDELTPEPEKLKIAETVIRRLTAYTQGLEFALESIGKGIKTNG